MRSKISAALFLFFLITSSVCFSATYRWRFEANGDSDTVSWRDGGIIQVAGDLDGATVKLEWYLVIDPVAATPGWISISPCDAIVAVGMCEFRVGAGSIRVNVSGGGASLDVWIGVTEIKIGALGGGTADWDTITGGTSDQNFLVTTGGSFGPDGSGAIAATTSSNLDADLDGVTNLSLSAGVVSIDTDDDGSADFLLDSSSFTRSLRGTGSLFRIYYSTSTFVGEMSSSGISVVNLVGFNQGALARSTTSSTVPSILVYSGADSTSGIGRDSISGGVSVIDNATEVFRAVSTYGMTMGCKNFGKLSVAPAGVACDRYYDTDLNTYCTHNGTEFRDDFTGMVTCS